MKSMGRTNFIVAANIVWLALFAAEVFAVLAPDYMAWWQHEGARSLRACNEDTVRYSLPDRMFLFGLIWLFSASVMSLFALRIPEQWPGLVLPALVERNRARALVRDGYGGARTHAVAARRHGKRPGHKHVRHRSGAVGSAAWGSALLPGGHSQRLSVSWKAAHRLRVHAADAVTRAGGATSHAGRH